MYSSTGDGTAAGGDPASLAAAAVGSSSRWLAHAPDQNTAATLIKVTVGAIHDRDTFSIVSERRLFVTGLSALVHGRCEQLQQTSVPGVRGRKPRLVFG
jgi:hypothetical protein